MLMKTLPFLFLLTKVPVLSHEYTSINHKDVIQNKIFLTVSVILPNINSPLG